MTPSPITHYPSPRIAVIGAGVIGAAVAFRLAEKGVPVILFDRSDPGRGATAASYGWVNANRKLLRAYFDLSLAAMEEYRRLAWRLAPAPWYHVDGNLIWFDDPARAAALRVNVQRLQEWGYAAEWLPASRVLADLEPGLAFRAPDTAVAWFPAEGWVDAPAMTRRLAQGVRNAGGRVLTGPEREVVDIGAENGRVSSIVLRGGQTIPVHKLVNAAGPDASRIAAMVGRLLPMAPRPGLSVRAEVPDGSDPLRRPLETDHIAIRPDGPGRVLMALPLDAEVELDDAPAGPVTLDAPLVSQVLAWGVEVLPALAAARPVEALVGVRPIPADGFPSVGAVPGRPGYYEAVTHSGVTLAPLISRSLADEILGQAGNPLLRPFRPERFESA
ncbi:MAG: FAD-binding oxidoreductase [Chloroflexi bacterium]|nr:FAD-binding oxidoreductase [Chloroflexota bacterium]